MENSRWASTLVSTQPSVILLRLLNFVMMQCVNTESSPERLPQRVKVGSCQSAAYFKPFSANLRLPHFEPLRKMVQYHIPFALCSQLKLVTERTLQLCLAAVDPDS